MENKRYYMKVSYPFIFIVVILLINVARVLYNILSDGYTSDRLFEMVAWVLISIVFIYAIIRIANKSVYVELQQDRVFYKGLFQVEKFAPYTSKCEAKSGYKNHIKKISFYDKKELRELVIQKYAFREIDEIYLEIQKRLK